MLEDSGNGLGRLDGRAHNWAWRVCLLHEQWS
jgi:hypothetical protein